MSGEYAILVGFQASSAYSDGANYPVPGSEIVGPAELRKSEEESKTFRVPFSFASSPLGANWPGGYRA